MQLGCVVLDVAGDIMAECRFRARMTGNRRNDRRWNAFITQPLYARPSEVIGACVFRGPSSRLIVPGWTMSLAFWPIRLMILPTHSGSGRPFADFLPSFICNDKNDKGLNVQECRSNSAVSRRTAPLPPWPQSSLGTARTNWPVLVRARTAFSSIHGQPPLTTLESSPMCRRGRAALAHIRAGARSSP